ncbi:UPF0758 domain-containing protein [Pedobacter sp. GR22-6]|uniref:UPF0758 domain-containing protein n=1 Tax=Pedobacter sp. GR22-6 TaxID=3127957 RepID=UPI00307E5893
MRNKSKILESETFGDGRLNYFIDFAQSENNSRYLKITRSERQGDNKFSRNSVVIFERDFLFLIESFSMLFSSIAEREKKESLQRPTPSYVSLKSNRGIKSWELGEWPRERLIEGGPGSVSDAELVALLIGSGTKRLTAVDLAKKILVSVENDLRQLGRLSPDVLKKFPGIGDAKAVNILAALEIGRRMSLPIPIPVQLKAI